PHYCAGTADNEDLLDQYVCGDSRLGPSEISFSALFHSSSNQYERFGALCPGQFLQTWFNTSIQAYNYPPYDGFQVDVAGAPIRHVANLTAGSLIDRFGDDHGYYLSPVGTPYAQRSLPPSRLNLFHYWSVEYHLYQVQKAFVAEAGPIASWFGQPGQGLQYRLFDNVSTLLDTGYL
ncbi:hypothetical protein GQ53DRAFT_596426, partial [Thozetella sp. PMI_491]